MSGRFGIHNGAVNHGGSRADMRHQGAERAFRSKFASNSLWQIFRKAGMHTCSISPFAERHSSYWFLAGLNAMHNHVGKGGDESAEEVTPTVLEWIGNHADQANWMLHVNYWDSHTPYRAPAEFGNPFRDEHIGSILAERGPEHACSPTTDRSMASYRTYFQRLRDTDRGQWIDTIVERHPEFAPAV